MYPLSRFVEGFVCAPCIGAYFTNSFLNILAGCANITEPQFENRNQKKEFSARWSIHVVFRKALVLTMHRLGCQSHRSKSDEQPRYIFDRILFGCSRRHLDSSKLRRLDPSIDDKCTVYQQNFGDRVEVESVKWQMTFILKYLVRSTVFHGMVHVIENF